MYDGLTRSLPHIVATLDMTGEFENSLILMNLMKPNDVRNILPLVEKVVQTTRRFSSSPIRKGLPGV